MRTHTHIVLQRIRYIRYFLREVQVSVQFAARGAGTRTGTRLTERESAGKLIQPLIWGFRGVEQPNSAYRIGGTHLGGGVGARRNPRGAGAPRGFREPFWRWALSSGGERRGSDDLGYSFYRW